MFEKYLFIIHENVSKFYLTSLKVPDRFNKELNEQWLSRRVYVEFPGREGNSGLGYGAGGDSGKTRIKSDVYYGWKVTRHLAEWRLIEIG